MERTAVLDKGQLLDDIGTSILAIPEHPKPYWELMLPAPGSSAVLGAHLN